MEFDPEKIDDVVLAVLLLTAFKEHGVTRAWTSVAWDVTDRLRAKGCIYDSSRSAKSVCFTDEGLARARAVADELFASSAQGRAVE